jgi:hypothetical protein
MCVSTGEESAVLRKVCCGVVALLVAGYFAAAAFARPVDVTTADRPPATALAAASTATTLPGTPLLLVHGWSDSCRAFNSVDLLAAQSGTAGQSTVAYLTSHGVPRSLIRMVGYYDRAPWPVTWKNRPNFTYPESDAASTTGYPTSDTPNGDCDVNVFNDPHFNDTGAGGNQCSGFQAANTDYYTNESLIYLSCVFAWYVFDTYPAIGQPVNILAHSMGGLVVRAAMAFSGKGQAWFKPGFPTAPQAVDRIVTVATPHGGLDGMTAGMYNSSYPAPRSPT